MFSLIKTLASHACTILATLVRLTWAVLGLLYHAPEILQGILNGILAQPLEFVLLLYLIAAFAGFGLLASVH